MNVSEWWFALGGVFLLGLQTSICPCPLMSNITAISFIGMRRSGKPLEILVVGLLYAVGQMIAYSLAAFCILRIPLFSGDQLTRLLTSTLHVLLGPILILIGMALAGLIGLRTPGINGERMQRFAECFGLASALPLGVIFALALCPTTAAMFLIMLSLAMKANSTLVFPVVFGAGATLPVILCAFVLAFQIRLLGKVFGLLGKIDACLRPIMGVVFILVGIFLTLRTLWAMT